MEKKRDRKDKNQEPVKPVRRREQKSNRERRNEEPGADKEKGGNGTSQTGAKPF